VPLASENRGLPGGLFSLLLRFPLHTVVERGACVFWDAQTQAASPCAHYWCFRAWSDKIASSGRWTFWSGGFCRGGILERDIFGANMAHTTDANERMNRPLDAVDPAIAELLRDEAQRQATGLELIPSENLVSEAVLEAMGSIFTNKYAEGYPGKRYYGGCEFADKVEQLAIDRAKEIFGAEHANVQAHSGTSANVAVYMSTLQPGDTVLGMNLAHGGTPNARTSAEFFRAHV
jgi:hypothetical protein